MRGIRGLHTQPHQILQTTPIPFPSNLLVLFSPKPTLNNSPSISNQALPSCTFLLSTISINISHEDRDNDDDDDGTADQQSNEV